MGFAAVRPRRKCRSAPVPEVETSSYQNLTPRSVIEKFSAMPMIDVEIPTTDGRELHLTRYTGPEAELRLLLEKLKLELPAQPPPKIALAEARSAASL